MGVKSEFSTRFTESQKTELLRGIFNNYYKQLPPGTIIFDSNRSWCARLALLNQLFPDFRMICCVRNVAWIMDSFERLVQENPLVYSRIFNDDNERGTVYSRTEALARQNRVVGYSVAALREAYYGPNSSALLLVDYELLTRFPLKCMQLVYDFLEEKSFVHDPENVFFEKADFDANMGVPDMHKVRKIISYKERTTLLPPDLFQKYEKISFWTDTEATAASIISVPAQLQKKTDA
jgi:sulfotransferase